MTPAHHYKIYSSWRIWANFPFQSTPVLYVTTYKQWSISDDRVLKWRRRQKNWPEQLWPDARRLWFWHRQLHSLGLSERILQQVRQLLSTFEDKKRAKKVRINSNVLFQTSREQENWAPEVQDRLPSRSQLQGSYETQKWTELKTLMIIGGQGGQDDPRERGLRRLWPE